RVEELAAVRPGGDVRDDVEILPDRDECALERVVEVRGEKQRILRARGTEENWKRGHELVHVSRRTLAAEELVQLVVQRAHALLERHQLRDATQAAVALEPVAGGELLGGAVVDRLVPNAASEDDDDATREECAHDL